MSGSPSNDRLQSLQNSISQYLAQTAFDIGSQGEIDRIERRLGSNPEQFITPNPGVPFQEDLSGNWERIKSEFGLTPKRELQEQLKNYDRQVRDFLIDAVRESIDDVGVFAVANYVYGGLSTGDRAVDDTIDDILAEASPDVFRAEIDNRLGNIEQEVPGGLGFRRGGDAEADAVDALNEITDQQFSDLDRALDAIEQQLQTAEADAEQRIISRFEQAFGQRFDDVDDAINSLRDQFDALQDLDIRTVEAAFLGGDATPNVSLPPGFGDLEATVADRIGGVIDLEATAAALPSRNRKTPFADVRIREGDIEQIDYGKAVQNPNIVIREDAALGPDDDTAGPPTGPDDTEIDEVGLDDDADDEPEPEPPTPSELIDEDTDNEEAAQLAADALEASDDAFQPMRAFANALSVDEAFQLAAAIERESIPADLIDRLTEFFQSASRDARREGRQQNRGLREIQAELIGLPGEFGEAGGEDIEIFEREVDETNGNGNEDGGPTREDVMRERGVDPDFQPSGGDPTADDLRSQRGSDRPDPDQPEADRRLQPLLDNSLSKAQQWIAAESERLDRTDPNGDPLPPAQFWDSFGSQIWSMLSRREFVSLTVDGIGQ